jgi:hypothetical protein
MNEDETEIAVGPHALEAEEIHASEETPVIDVHMPHPTHTWKDFFIHIATITVGLLIAISLEQTVEWMHHLHQRHQLEEDLHAEAAKNLAIMDDDYLYFDASLAQTAANRDRVDAMRASGGKMKLSYLPFKNPHANGVGSTAPLASVWTTAKESESIALLPREEAKFYARVYRQQEMYLDANNRLTEVAVEKTNFDAQFAAFPQVTSGPMIDPDLSRMSVEQLGEESALLTKFWVATNNQRVRLDFFYAAEAAVLQGGVSDDDVLRHLVRRPRTIQPDATATDPNGKQPGKP